MNKNLNKAKVSKNDEFYTSYEDVEKEIDIYYNNDNDIFKDKTILLPCNDYDGVMGVPISFLTKYNPNQFEVINMLNRCALYDEDKYIINNGNERVGKHMCSIDNGKRIVYSRLTIKHKKKQN